MNRIDSIILASLAIGAGAACGGDDDAGGGPDGGGVTTRSMTFSLDGVPALGAGYVYEGWIIDATGPHSTGRFTVGDDGATDPAAFDIDAALADTAEKVVITIEPATGDDPAPSAVHILAGDVNAGEAALSIGDDAALGTDFADAAGSYVLATPSTSEEVGDNDQGIWWLVPGEAPAPALTLPALPDGWMYEGWVVGPDGPVSTGTFTVVSGADSDGPGATAGPDAAPPFPGQDFIDPPVVLTVDHAAVISVEPDPDDGAAPFALKPLIDATIEAVAAPDTQDMTNMAGAAPSGSAAFE